MASDKKVAPAAKQESDITPAVKHSSDYSTKTTFRLSF
jgi:hypothetical protein